MDLSKLSDQDKAKFSQYFSSHLVWGASREISPRIKIKRKCVSPYDDIILITQFFIPTDQERYKEIKKALDKNCLNKKIQKIYLLNEKIYSSEELGSNSNKIEQINIESRLSFKKVFDFIDEQKINGIIVFCNSDIFFDQTLEKLPKVNLGENKDFIGLLRYEYKNEKNLNDCKIFGPRWDSQDAWILHSKQNVDKKHRDVFSFCFGQPGCDNKLLFLMKILGYKIYNDPNFLRSYHIHNQQGRNYNIQNVEPQYFYSIPPDLNFNENNMNMDYGILKANTYDYQRFNYTTDHNIFKTYLSHYLIQNKPILIPMIDNVKINNEFSNEVFNHCDTFFCWEHYGLEYRIASEHSMYIDNNYPQKTSFWTRLQDIFYYIYMNPWTQLLKGKRILLISSDIDAIKLNVKKPVYPIDLYPECKFKYINFTFDALNNFSDKLKELKNKVTDMKEGYDIALLDAGPYNNFIASELFKISKDAIVIGQSLRLHFGVYNELDEKKHSDILKLYKNKHWEKVQIRK